MPNPAEIVASWRADRETRKVFEAFVYQAPNAMRFPHLQRLLPQLSETAILQALERLVSENRLEVRTRENTVVPGRAIVSWKLADVGGYPMRQSIEIGGVEFPRMIDGDSAGAEDFNVFIEALAEYEAEIEERVARLASKLTRRYWANIATLFALFVAVFALILRGTEPLVVDPSATPWSVVGLQAARLIPLASVLLAFVVAISVVVRKA